jgi:hypothetical protein
VIGEGYEQQLPHDERHALGQYYTPAIVCDFICRLVIDTISCVVLDPACGSGEFLVAACKRLHDLHATRGSTLPIGFLDQVHGIEINEQPASTTRDTIARFDPGRGLRDIRVVTGDFFDVEPGTPPFPAKVDVVIGNPPYIRQERITDKQKARAHLVSSSTTMDERADIYVYFFTRAAQWLGERGKIGYLTSERYLDTGYGRDLQHFMLAHFTIKAIIAFDKQLFTDALVGTIITILEKEPDARVRAENMVRFLRVKQRMAIDDIEALLGEMDKHSSHVVHDTYNLTRIPQHSLGTFTKWRRFLFAPPIFFELEQSTKLVAIAEIASIKRGITSGANSFFYRREHELISLEATYPGLKRYFTPLLKAIGQSDWLMIQSVDTDWYVLDIHSLIQDIQDEADKTKEVIDNEGKFIFDIIKKKLREKGHGVLVNYINAGEAATLEYCESEHPDKAPTCITRKVWFDLRDLPLGGIGFPKEYWTKFLCPMIDDGISLDARVYYVVAKTWKNIDPRVDKKKVLAAILNSDLSAIFYEFSGRVYAGQALDRASCMVYEANAMRIIDPRQLETRALLEIQAKFDAIITSERVLIPQKTKATFFEIDPTLKATEKDKRIQYVQLRTELNRAILDAVGMGERIEEIKAEVQRLVELRRKRGGGDTRLLVGNKSPG